MYLHHARVCVHQMIQPNELWEFRSSFMFNPLIVEGLCGVYIGGLAVIKKQNKKKKLELVCCWKAYSVKKMREYWHIVCPTLFFMDFFHFLLIDIEKLSIKKLSAPSSTHLYYLAVCRCAIIPFLIKKQGWWVKVRAFFLNPHIWRQFSHLFFFWNECSACSKGKSMATLKVQTHVVISTTEPE